MQTRTIHSRDSSPAGSEISVGSPSPPPSPQRKSDGKNYFQPLKRLRMSASGDEDNNNRHSGDETSQRTTATSTTTKTPESGSGKSSFSIADILGRSDSNKSSKNIVRDTIVNGLSQLHQQQQQFNQVAKIVRPWDHLQYPSLRPSILPPALLHYEQRLAMEYHQQLQEHFHAQAQLLRHMNLASQHPHDIIPSESGSDRSSSVASDCCSPDITGRSSENSSVSRQQMQQKSNNNNKSPNGTPLDALFQLSNKNFDEAAEEGELVIAKLNNFFKCFLNFFSRNFPRRFIFHPTPTKEEAKITHSLHKSSNFRAREAISLSEISLTC